MAKHQMCLVNACETVKPVMFVLCGLACMLTAGGGGKTLMPGPQHPPFWEDSLGLQYCSIAAMHKLPASSQTNLKLLCSDPLLTQMIVALREVDQLVH